MKVSLVSAQAAGAHTFVPSDKSKQKRSVAVHSFLLFKYTLSPPSTADYEAGQSDVIIDASQITNFIPL